MLPPIRTFRRLMSSFYSCFASPPLPPLLPVFFPPEADVLLVSPATALLNPALLIFIRCVKRRMFSHRTQANVLHRRRSYSTINALCQGLFAANCSSFMFDYEHNSYVGTRARAPEDNITHCLKDRQFAIFRGYYVSGVF